MKQIVIFHTAICVMDNYYIVNLFSLICLMYAISSYKKALIIQIPVHSHTDKVRRWASKQVILYNYVLCYK